MRLLFLGGGGKQAEQHRSSPGAQARGSRSFGVLC
jgi:hypothetical protein